MSDNADVADDVIAHNLALAMSARPTANPGQCALECVVCGEVIPEARRLAMLDRGCSRCIDCQELADRRGVRA
ncbi:TraR/DksA C4-type zinc finger protein [Pseudomonas grimontii]|uniref:TraR/DksA C4-type zinc finger protein n=1 Tax=Pseudomonas grimontii TaxID=129847 RepID=UPI00387B5F9E